MLYRKKNHLIKTTKRSPTKPIDTYMNTKLFMKQLEREEKEHLKQTDTASALAKKK